MQVHCLRVTLARSLPLARSVHPPPRSVQRSRRTPQQAHYGPPFTPQLAPTPGALGMPDPPPLVAPVPLRLPAKAAGSAAPPLDGPGVLGMPDAPPTLTGNPRGDASADAATAATAGDCNGAAASPAHASPVGSPGRLSRCAATPAAGAGAAAAALLRCCSVCERRVA